ncbi:MAG: aminoacyl-tRNA hydrolase [Clostridia bacterium]|nr:aminoacyl-tRNA hydrolase [Clostridia bacterium]
MYVIVGLGNPGKEYENTRHNVGYMVLDSIAGKLGLSGGRDGFRSTYIETRIGTERVVLAKPTTYMNNSGFAVRDLVNWYKCEPHELLLIYDDIELPTGDIRIREKGSAGTHNGMRSVIYQLGLDTFPRIRVGIGKQADGRDLISHVLGVPSEEDKKLLSDSIAQATEAALMIVNGEITAAQTRFNKKKSGKKKPEPEKTEETDTDTDE